MLKHALAVLASVALFVVSNSVSQASEEDDKREQWSGMWLYAQLAVNAYNPQRTPHFRLPEHVRPMRFSDNEEYNGVRGFAFAVFGVYDDNDQLSEIVISYRGTENHNSDDWFRGNFYRGQNRSAVQVFDDYRREYGDVPISVVGDSLGGALAAQVGICRNVHRRFAMNTSPRYSTRFCGGDERSTYTVEEKQSRYLLFVNRGEALQFVRWAFLRSERVQTYISRRCRRGAYSGILRHSADFAARCVTLRAAALSSPEACESVRRNAERFDEAGLSLCRPQDEVADEV